MNFNVHLDSLLILFFSLECLSCLFIALACEFIILLYSVLHVNSLRISRVEKIFDHKEEDPPHVTVDGDEHVHGHSPVGYNYPSESTRKLYYDFKPHGNSHKLHTTTKPSTEKRSKSNESKTLEDKIVKSESIHEPAYIREYGRLTEYPNPDEKLKGWKETGYRIVTEIEYSDKGKYKHTHTQTHHILFLHTFVLFTFSLKLMLFLHQTPLAGS